VFKGEGIEDTGGASKVLVYRIGAAAAAKATRAIQNTTPATALTLSAKYEGTLGNGLKAQVVDNAANPGTHNDLIISDASGELERYVHAQTDINALAADINARSAWVTAVANISGVALGLDGSAVALSGGNDGSTLVAGDWTIVRTAFETQRFSVFVPYDLTDQSLHAAFKTWVQGQNNAGKRFLLVLGARDATMANALTDADTFDDPDVALFGGGTVTDSTIIDPSTNQPVSLSPSLFAPRVAGIIAARGEVSSISFARLKDVTVVAGPTATEVQNAIDGGVVTFDQDSDQEAPVRLETGVTTYQSNTAVKPKSVFGQIKFVRTQHGIEIDFQDYQQKNVIGKLPVNNDTRETLVGKMAEIIQRRVDATVVQDSATVEIDQDPPPSDDQDFVQVKYGVKFTRSTEKVYNTVYVG
jgi:hypothetical protein